MSEPQPVKRARWQVGTLSYTGAGLAGLFFWLLWGDFGYFLKERGVPPAVQLLMGRLEVPDIAVGLLIGSLPWVISIFVVPVVAYRSDRHRSRWGRRIPFLVLPTLTTFVGMVVMAFCPQLGRELHAMLGTTSPGEKTLVILTLVIGWTVFEVGTIIANAVFLSLIADVVPQAVIGRFFALFRVVSLLAGIIFNYYLFGYIDQHYTAIFLGIGAVYCASFLVMCLKVKEGQYPPPAPAEEPGLARGWASVRSYCRDCFAIPYYRWVFASLALGYMAAVPIGLFAVLFANALGMSMADFGRYGAIQLFVSLLQAYPVGWLADRFHPMRIMLIALVSVIVSTAAAFWLVRDASDYGWAIVICGTLAGFYGNAIAALPAVLFPKEKFATYDSARQVTIALGGIIVGPLCGLTLDYLRHDYRYMYLWACVLALGGLAASLVAYRYFLRYGGPKAYVAPGSATRVESEAVTGV